MKQRLAALSLALILGLVSFFLLKPFFSAILTAIIFSIIFYPIYRFIKHRFEYKSISAFLVCIIIVLLVIIPSGIVINALVIEADSAFRYIRSSPVPMQILEFTQDKLNAIPYTQDLRIDVTSSFSVAAKYSLDYLRTQAASIPTKILFLLISIVLIYYLLKDGKHAIRFCFEVLPLRENQKQKIIQQCTNVTYAVVYGQIITAIIQGIAATVGYYIFGAKAALLFGVLTIFFALIPYFGTAIIWLPLSAYLFMTGFENGLWWKGIGLFLYGLLVISLLDNFIRPKLIGDKGDVHPAIVLLGVIGGIPLFGFVGIFIGPLLLALFITSLTFIQGKY